MWSIDEDIVQRVKVAGIFLFTSIQSYDRNIIVIVYTTELW